MYKALNRIVILFFLITVMSGCIPDRQIGSTPPLNKETPIPTPEPMKWNTIAVNNELQANPTSTRLEDQPRLNIISKPSDLENSSKWLRQPHLQALEVIDYSKTLVAIVFMGWEGGDGFSIEIKSVSKRNTTVTIEANFISPAEGEPSTQIVTSPYYIIGMDKNTNLAGSITFVLVNQKGIIDQITINTKE